MEGIVAKRCLRQSSIGKEMYESRVNKKNRLNEIYRKNNTISKSLHREERNTRNRFEKFIFKMVFKVVFNHYLYSSIDFYNNESLIEVLEVFIK